MIRLVIGLLLILLPVAELAVLIKTGQLIGVWATVGLLVGMAFAGMLVLSRQSLTAFRQTLEALNEGRLPVAPVLDGLFLMLAGALLLMPGLISDAAALVLLVPPVRRAVAVWSMRRMLGARVDNGDADARGRQRVSDAGNEPRGGPTIEGDFERLDEKAPRQQGQ
jgi:UPF0716 protein FxsA